ncbi:MAG: family 20 glycosylhydrolase, partial [Armatimonadota bacterium]
LEELGGPRLDTLHAHAVSKDPAQAQNLIIIGEADRNELLHAVCKADLIRMPRSKVDSAYVIDVLPERVVVWGRSPVGTRYAVQTLKQLIEVGENGALRVPAVNVRDFPTFAFRGAHLLAARDALQYIGKLIERVLAPLKINHIVLQTDKVAWKSHPEVVDPDNFMTPEDVRKLIEIARRHHIKVTPLVQSPGHLEWAFRDRRNLVFAEDPKEPYCYCMSNPKSYEFIFSIMDEAIEIFGHPEYFHAGRDEFDMRGEMPYDEACRAIGKERLYIQDTLKVYEHLKSKGCKMMMWGDVLTKEGFRELADQLPKDILINDWRYGPSQTYPSIDFYKSLGFPVIGCTWYNPRNIALFSKYAASREIMGMMQTTWTGFAPEETVLKQWPEQAYAYVLSAAWSWNPYAFDVDTIPYRADVIFKQAWSGRRTDRRGRFFVVSLDRYCNISRVDSGRKMGWLGIGRGCDLRDLPTGLVSIDGVPYRILPDSLDTPAVIMLGGNGVAEALPRQVQGIRIAAKVKSLHFLHACAYGAENNAHVGSYLIRYKDGTMEKIDLVADK